MTPTNHTVFQLERIFRNAASYGISEWNRPFSEVDDLKQKLWEWYLKRPSTQEKLQALETYQVTNMVKRIAIQILSETQDENDFWDGKSRYTPDNVKDALQGTGSNPYLIEILPQAFKVLESRNLVYAQAVRTRYLDGVVPPQGSKFVQLTRATKALTDIVNTIAITADGTTYVKDGPGSRRVMQKKRPVYKHEEHPELIKSKGEHSDPTADIAIMLIENPGLRDDYLHRDPITEFTKGPRA